MIAVPIAAELKINHAAIEKARANSVKWGVTGALKFIRTRARSTQVLRRRKKPSRPGQSPSVHSSGYASLKNIRYAYYGGAEYGVVGPVKLNLVSFGIKYRTTVPHILEAGGTLRIEEEFVDLSGTQLNRGEGFWTRIDRRRTKTDRKKRWRRVTIKPRPYMSKALDIEIKSGNITIPFVETFRE